MIVCEFECAYVGRLEVVGDGNIGNSPSLDIRSVTIRAKIPWINNDVILNPIIVSYCPVADLYTEIVRTNNGIVPSINAISKIAPYVNIDAITSVISSRLGKFTRIDNNVVVDLISTISLDVDPSTSTFFNEVAMNITDAPPVNHNTASLILFILAAILVNPIMVNGTIPNTRADLPPIPASSFDDVISNLDTLQGRHFPLIVARTAEVIPLCANIMDIAMVHEGAVLNPFPPERLLGLRPDARILHIMDLDVVKFKISASL